MRHKTLCILVALLLLSGVAEAQYNVPPTTGCSAGTATRWSGSSWNCETTGSTPAGLITFVITGTCPAGWTEVTALNGKAIYGTLAANADVGGAVGTDTITPTVNSLTAAAQTFTGSSTTVPAETVNSLTAAGQTVNSLTAAAQTVNSLTAAAQTITWPVNVPTHSGITINNMSQTKFTTSGSGTSADTTLTPTINSQGTVAWPVNPPTNGSSAVTGTMNSSAVTGTMNSSAVTGTLNSTTITPLGSNAASAVTGTLNSFNNRPAGIKAIFCSKD